VLKIESFMIKEEKLEIIQRGLLQLKNSLSSNKSRIRIFWGFIRLPCLFRGRLSDRRSKKRPKPLVQLFAQSSRSQIVPNNPRRELWGVMKRATKSMRNQGYP
jgi:hypothetical protein